MKDIFFSKIKFPLVIIALGLMAEISYISADQNTYKNKCSRCHSLKEPNKYSRVEWKKNVERMAKRAGLTRAEIDSIIKLNTR
ncbi:MAG TPA: hypothetical protein PK358_13015 [Spirochaetota bacterium]|nr:hypothetical protein [Spirochaetota bacterium]HPJ35750.1 hypothetical protein [Spirochaetota bacterium]